MYTPDGSIGNTDPGDLGLPPNLGLQLIDSTICGNTATPGEFEEGLCTRGAPHSGPMVGVCAQRRAAGREVVFGMEDDPPVDLLALEYGLTRSAVVIA